MFHVLQCAPFAKNQEDAVTTFMKKLFKVPNGIAYINLNDLLDLAVINAKQIFYATHECNSIFSHFANYIFIGYLNRLLLIDVAINMFSAYCK
jgi:hypothetical protein